MFERRLKALPVDLEEAAKRIGREEPIGHEGQNGVLRPLQRVGLARRDMGEGREATSPGHLLEDVVPQEDLHAHFT